MALHSEWITPRDLRRAPRLEFERRAWCEHRQLTLYLTVANLSRGGMFIHTCSLLTPGERLKVCVLASPSIVAEVEIVWAISRGRAGGVGCRIVSFLDGAADYMDLLAELGSDRPSGIMVR